MNGAPDVQAYLDASIIILLVEGTAGTRTEIRAELSRLGADHGPFLVSALTKVECLVKPLRTGDLDLEGTYRMFFAGSEIRDVEITTDVWERATRIRAKYGFRVPDAVHLAAATAAQCSMVLTRDERWRGFPDVPVQIL
jgi:predicted nucleic acid-binding protein